MHDRCTKRFSIAAQVLRKQFVNAAQTPHNHFGIDGQSLGFYGIAARSVLKLSMSCVNATYFLRDRCTITQ
jgi:hypothetical protein